MSTRQEVGSSVPSTIVIKQAGRCHPDVQLGWRNFRIQ